MKVRCVKISEVWQSRFNLSWEYNGEILPNGIVVIYAREPGKHIRAREHILGRYSSMSGDSVFEATQ